jgi:Zn-dependent M28 family amino/carboxypeptidase
MLSIDEKLADRLLKKYGKDTKTLRKQLDKREKVSFVTDIEAEVMVRSENFQGTALNVVGYIPGTDERLKHEFIVIGAHLDHCGMWPVLTPGADDNASGSAAVMAVAKALGTCEYRPKRSLLFILFAGEEMGLLGSTYFVSHLPAKIKKIKFVFNMDMVGAGPDVFILRLKNYPEVETVIREAREKLKLNCKIKGNKVTRRGRDGADHAPFVKKGIPAVSIFSSGGKHHGYHTDEDTIYWITPKITEDIAKIVAYSSMTIDN